MDSHFDTQPHSPEAMPRVFADADYRLLVDSIHDYAIFLMDAGGVILSWNPGAQALKGYAAHEVIGKHFSLFYPPELLSKNWPAHELERAAQTGKYEEEGWRVRKDGTRFWAHVIIGRLNDERGQLRGFSKITRDLTQRQSEADQLRASEERFRLMVDSVKDYAIFMLDPSGHVVSWNAGARALKGYDATEIIGRHFSVFYPDEVKSTDFLTRELDTARRTGRFEDEGWRVRKDGSRFWASVVISAVFDASGQLRGFTKITRDLSDRRKVTQLEDEGRRINNFLAVLGHELRNPLAPIANAAEVLSRRDQSPSIQRLTQIMLRQVRLIARLVDDLMDVGRITSGKVHLDVKPVRLSAIVDDALETMRSLAEAKSQRIDFTTDGSSLWVQGDRVRLIQIVCNLLSNAIKFTPAEGKIVIELRQAGRHAELVVRDNGPGIAPAALPRIFEMFQQVGDQAQALGGLGLGLTLVRQLAQLHGGEVHASSSGVQTEGSEFVVRIPRIEAPVVIGAETGASRRVLIVDDDHDSAETLSLLVESMGYEPVCAVDGLAGLQAIKTQRLHAVLLDLGLPGLSGLEIARRMKVEIADPPPLVAITGYGQSTDRQASIDAGFRFFFTKPVDVAGLQGVLESLS